MYFLSLNKFFFKLMFRICISVQLWTIKIIHTNANGFSKLRNVCKCKLFNYLQHNNNKS